MATLKNPIGQLKSKVKVYCTLCVQPYTRNLSVYVYENNQEAICKAKEEIRVRAAKPYTCNICKSIEKAGN